MLADLPKIIYCSIGSVIVLFILTKLMGAKQISQLSMFDYIIGITIGSIAAEMATSIQDNFMEPLIAMTIYAVAAVLLSKIAEKSITLRRYIVGKPVFIFNNGKLYRKNMRKANIDMSAFLTQCRVNGYFDLSQIKSAILEPNGRISFLPFSNSRPATPGDLNLTIPEESVAANIILDGHIMHENLRHTGNDEKWLNKQLSANNIKSAKDVFLATCDNDNKINIYIKINEDNKTDIFE